MFFLPGRQVSVKTKSNVRRTSLINTYNDYAYGTGKMI